MTIIEGKIAALQYVLEQDDMSVTCWQDPSEMLTCLKSIQTDFATLQAENARLRQENEELESVLTETVTTLTQAVETLAQGQLEIVQHAGER
jgi:regulator of replication initiation timing